MSDDDDDEVVDEIPVYLSHELEEKLFIFQYPVIPSAVEGSLGDVLKCQIKPENQHVELEVKLDTDSINYDRTHGEQIAQSLENEEGDNPQFSGRHIMDRMVLSSYRSLNDTDSYCLGIMRDQVLHLSPIRGVLSLRPSLKHLEPDSYSNQKGPEELQQVRVQFARSESDRVKQLREQSYTTYAKRVSQEKWYHTKYHKDDSSMAQGTRKKVCSGIAEPNPVQFSLDGYKDLVSPVPPVRGTEQAALAQAIPSQSLSLNYLRQLPIQERVKTLLKEVKTVSLCHLIWTCREEDTEAVLRAVQDVAILVQGNWVIRSDLLFPKDTFSHHNGIPAEAMIRARDYILYQLNLEASIERRSLIDLVHIPAEELKDIMSQVALLKNNKVWTFRLPPDLDFINKYPAIVERETRRWAARFERLKEELEGAAALPSLKSPSKSRRRKDSARSSGGEDSEGAVNSKAAPLKTLAKRKKALPNATSANVGKSLMTRVNGVRAAVKMEPLDNLTDGGMAAPAAPPEAEVSS